MTKRGLKMTKSKTLRANMINVLWVRGPPCVYDYKKITYARSGPVVCVVFAALWKYPNNPACTKTVRVLMLKMDTEEKDDEHHMTE